MHALWQNQTMHCRYFDTLETAITLAFWHQQWLVGDALSVRNLRLNWPTTLKKMPTDRFPHTTSRNKRQRKSPIMMNRKSTMGFPMSYRWSAYVTLSPPESNFLFCFLIGFVTKHACDRQMDRQTYRQTHRITTPKTAPAQLHHRVKMLHGKDTKWHSSSTM